MTSRSSSASRSPSGDNGDYGEEMTANDSRIAAIERATGRSWDDWLLYLDGIGARELNHHEIATHLLDELTGMVDNIGWWAQSTANVYEQHIGRRIPGQQPDGSFRTSVSKATKLDMEALMTAWTEFAATDVDVAALISAEPRISGTDKRITWRVRGFQDTAVTVISEPKAGGTASLVVQHGGLPSVEVSAEAKASWVAIVARFLAQI